MALKPKAFRSLAAENILLRQQLIAIKRKRLRAPNLTPFDRVIFGLCSLIIRPGRLP